MNRDEKLFDPDKLHEILSKEQKRKIFFMALKSHTRNPIISKIARDIDRIFFLFTFLISNF